MTKVYKSSSEREIATEPFPPKDDSVGRYCLEDINSISLVGLRDEFGREHRRLGVDRCGPVRTGSARCPAGLTKLSVRKGWEV